MEVLSHWMVLDGSISSQISSLQILHKEVAQSPTHAPFYWQVVRIVAKLTLRNQTSSSEILLSMKVAQHILKMHHLLNSIKHQSILLTQLLSILFGHQLRKVDKLNF
jgi:hypothetical protein